MWILGVSRHHNGAVCLLHNGKIVFYLEEDRLSKIKHDGFCQLVFSKILNYTNKLDYVALAGYDPLDSNFEHLEFNVYFLLLVKLGLISSPEQIIDLTHEHHLCHASCGFYNSGFDRAVCVVIDGAGSLYPLENDNVGRETSSIITLEYPNKLQVLFKNIVTSSNSKQLALTNVPNNCKIIVSSILDIGKAYQSVSVYQGFDIYDCGKTMGWASYGVPDNTIPETFINGQANMDLFTHDRSLTIPQTDNFQTQANLALNVQQHTQQNALDLIKKAVSISGINNVVLTGGYALNCTANYFIRKNLNADINLYVEPISHDGGTAIGAAKLIHHRVTNSTSVNSLPSLYLGPSYNISLDDAVTVTENDIVDLLLDKHIVAVFQGRSEAGPRALGNRSLLFDPRLQNGKDIVNKIKRREIFRPFAASVLEEYAHDWFDLAGMANSPYMMYAVDVIIDKQPLIPAVVHVDGTCRIQTVSQKEHNFYALINEFYKRTGVPMLFNTSFNLAGDPLVETLEDAISTLNRSNIEYLYLPDIQKLVHIPNK